VIDEPFARGDSFLHGADPRIKIICSALIIPVVALTTRLPVAAAALAFAVFLVVLIRPPLAALARRMAAVQVFLLFLWVILPLSAGGPTGFRGLSRQGVELALLITLKSNAIVLLTISLLATSPIQRIGQGLHRLSRSPKMTMLLLLTYRYLFVIAEEFQRLRRAARLRCFQPRTSLHTYRTYGHLIGMTLVRSWERAGRIRNAMILRGFSGTFHYIDLLRMRPADWLLLFFFALVALLLPFVPETAFFPFLPVTLP